MLLRRCDVSNAVGLPLALTPPPPPLQHRHNPQVRDRATGEEFACKQIPKVLPADAAASDAKRRGHADAIRREVDVMRRLEGSLAVVRLIDVFEDERHVFIVQELCRGGELHHRIGDRHYSERTVASFMRAVLRTIAQCHSRHILHRDIKPENFLMLVRCCCCCCCC